MPSLAQLIDQAASWLTIDPDPQTRAQLAEILDLAKAGDQQALADLSDRFSGNLQFGTAGLRASLGAGPMRMNRVVVRRAAAGLANYIKGRAQREGWSELTAIVGFDARTNSAIFAQESAAIFTAAGIKTYLFDQAGPTPLLAWATQKYGAEIGVMVTASHNPAQDNGYKVYLGGQAVDQHASGAQIVPPYDSDIATEIAAVLDSEISLAPAGWQLLPEGTSQDYLRSVAALGRVSQPDLSIVYTAMHGVGGQLLLAALQEAGFSEVHPVMQQLHPDPDFPTVAFPNPEEAGALDLALELAQEVKADLIIANDPDADRAAFALYDPSCQSWRQLSGDEVGALLGVAMIERLDTVPEHEPTPVFANSLVSSRLLQAIAQDAGLRHEQTLTGFKWIGRIKNLAYGYEEAIGYSVDPASVKDKDGIAAALLLALYAQNLKSAGSSLLEVLDQLAAKHGVYATQQVSIRVDQLSQIEDMVARLRKQPPKVLASSAVTEITDLSLGWQGFPPTPGFVYLMHNKSRVIVRPSGTEPKLKCYMEVIEDPDNYAGSLSQARAAAKKQLKLLGQDISLALGQ